jgi:hypothetical protein
MVVLTGRLQQSVLWHVKLHCFGWTAELQIGVFIVGVEVPRAAAAGSSGLRRLDGVLLSAGAGADAGAAR